jgi:hypothetical protein
MAVTTAWALTHSAKLPSANATSPPRQVRRAGDAADLPRAQPSVPTVEHRPLLEQAHQSFTKVEDALTHDIPPAILSELKSIDAMWKDIETDTPIDSWRFDGLRARYQALVKSHPGEPAVGNVIRDRLERLARRELAAKAAVTFEAILAQSRKRDREIVQLSRQLRIRTSSANGARSNTYAAIGFMQSSAQKIDGHKLFLLVGRNGETLAHLDIPPGLDPEPILARKVGVRGVAHYNEELQSRLITVRDLQAVESTR